MGQNLTGQTIASTYEDLVQISGSILTDGLGNDISFVDVSSSFALTASFALNAGGAETGSLMVTGSVNLNTLTFTKGDGTTFDLTVDTGSAVTIDTGSLLVTASISDATTTYTKGDGSTFALVTNNVNNAISASYATTADSATTATSASHALNADNAISSSYALTASYVEGGVDPFPYTGTASIDGALEVTGSIGGILTDGEDVIIYATQSANNLVPNILIGAQDPAQNGLNTSIGYNNVVLGTGEFITDLKGLASGSGNSNAVLGGFAGYIGRGNYNTIAGGGKNTIASGSTLANGTAAVYNFMAGGNTNVIGERTTNSSIIGGTSHEILPIGTNGSANSSILGGFNATISGSDWASIVGGRNGSIIFGNTATVIGGENNVVEFSSAQTSNAAILGGLNNRVGHVRSVILGGQNLTTQADDTVYTPNLNVSGSVELTGSNKWINATSGTATNLQQVAIASANSFTFDSAAKTSVIIATEQSTVGANANQAFVIGGSNNTVSQIRTGVVGGALNTATTSNSHLFGAGASVINTPSATTGYNVIVGGLNHDILGSSDNSVVVGGDNNTINNADNSVVLGGTNITATVSNTAYVPNLIVSGSANISGSTTIGGNLIISGSLNISNSASISGSDLVGNWSDIYSTTPKVTQIVTLTPTEYDALTPNDNTLYVVSQSAVTTYSVSNGQTASLDCSLGTHFIVNTTFTSASDGASITATNIEVGSVVYIRVNETGYPATTNLRPDLNAFTTGSDDIQWDNSVLMATSFDGTKLNVISFNLID